MSISTTALSSVTFPTDDGGDGGRKRKSDEEAKGSIEKMMKAGGGILDEYEKKPMAKVNSKGREIRLEQNRKAARESRRRKKVMIEELQRSVIFFSRANGTLKQQNDDLTRFLMQAQMQIAAIESHKENSAQATPAVEEMKTEDRQKQAEQAQANTVATQAIYETKGFPPAAARAAAEAMHGKSKSPSPAETQAATMEMASSSQTSSAFPQMQPGATMQAMANFQQAAAVAMQSAMGQMQNVPGVSLSQLAAAPAGTNAQQAYTDTMTALAMQQAAAAAAAGMIQPGMQFIPSLMPHWQQQQQQQHILQPQRADVPKKEDAVMEGKKE